MCKLAGWTAGKDSPLSRNSADRALIAACEAISKTERCGFGFAQSGPSGLHGRFVEPSDFRSLDTLPSLYDLSGRGYAAFTAAHRSEQTGYYHRNKPTIVHGRTATCAVNLANTHPFRHKGWTLAHNGVVTWHGKQTKEHRKATCDSQHLLYALVDHAGDREAQQAAMKHITGYAAFLALSPRGRLIVAVDAMASLYAGITKKGRWIFGTKPSIIEAIADAWGCKGVEAFAIEPWTWMEFAAGHGEPDSITKWQHGEVTRHEAKHSQRSLGRSLADEAWEARRSEFSVYSSGKSGSSCYRTYPVPSGSYDGLAARSEDVGMTQQNLDDDLLDEAEWKALRSADAEAESLQGMGDWVPASQRTMPGIE
jgi:hypothetical protein